ncbi:Vesicle transport protein S20 [Dispira parvispora]|uniref:Vesicle transport protein S20 n=1 Tax=Dispira parvispora TaxID=1520584 RepID=A0A9W8E837_9FUNG|nr:Vesicle transport protein S20 [Dispira parvispora]
MSTTALLDESLARLVQEENDLGRLIATLTTSVTSKQEQQELAGLIRERHKQLQKTIQRLTISAETLDRESDRQVYLERVVAHEKHWKQVQTAIRTALLKSEKALARITRDERAELFKGVTVETIRANELRRRRQAEGNMVAEAANDVTESLRRTTQLMVTEVERSSINASQFQDSTQMVWATLSEHQSLSGLLRTSQTIITKLEQGDWTDRLILLFGLFVFFGVVLYILQRRLWFPGFGILRWLVRQLFFTSKATTETALPMSIVTATIGPTLETVGSG